MHANTLYLHVVDPILVSLGCFSELNSYSSFDGHPLLGKPELCRVIKTYVVIALSYRTEGHMRSTDLIQFGKYFSGGCCPPKPPQHALAGSSPPTPRVPPWGVKNIPPWEIKNIHSRLFTNIIVAV